MKAFYTFFFFIVAMTSIDLSAQNITHYAFAAGNTPFTPLTGAPDIPAMAAANYISHGIPLGFTFWYMGKPYTEVAADVNGILSFNDSAVSANANDLDSGLSRPLIAPLWDDLAGVASDGSVASYNTSGTPGSRIFTFEWLNWEWASFSSSPNISFQVKLYETTGKIEFSYRREPGSANRINASIGLAGNDIGSFLSLSDAGTSPVVSATIEEDSISTKPATNQLYSFTSPTPSAPTNFYITSIQLTRATLNWTDNASNETRYAIYQSTDSISFNLFAVIDSNSTTYTAEGLVPGVKYYWQVRAVTEGALSTMASASMTAVNHAILSGSYTINNTQPLTATNFQNFNDAFAVLNYKGLNGAVIMNVSAGQVFNEKVQPLKATGTTTRAIVFQKSGTGANPVINRTDTGVYNTTWYGAQGDGIIVLDGSDFITFNGIDVTATDSRIEYGYFLRKASGSDACKNVTIKNAAITMQGDTTAFVTGIYAANLTKDAPPYYYYDSLIGLAPLLTVTSISGRHENVVIAGNKISNVYIGISLGNNQNTSAPANFPDSNFIIGAPGAGNGNKITHFGTKGIGNFNSATASGIYIPRGENVKVEYNTIDNVANGGSPTEIYLSGIISYATLPVIMHNNINLKSITSALVGIKTQSTGNIIIQYDTLSLNNLNNSIYNNNGFTFIDCGSGNSDSSNIIISNNNFANSTINSSGNQLYFIKVFYANLSDKIYIENNKTSGLINTDGYLSGCEFTSYGGGTQNFSGNNFSNILAPYFIGYSGDIYTSYYNMKRNIFNNIFSHITAYSFYGVSIKNGFNRIFNNKIADFTIPTSYCFYRYCGSLTGGAGINTSHENANALLEIDSIYNNYIGDIKSFESPSNPSSNYFLNKNSFFGILLYPSNGNANGKEFIYFNTIDLDISAATKEFHCNGIVAYGVLTELQNNLVITKSNNISVATALSTSIAQYTLTSDNNLLYAGAPAANHRIFSTEPFVYGNSIPQVYDTTLLDYKVRAFPRERSSISEMPPFISINGGDAAFLHIDTSIATGIRNGGKAIAGITTDYDGDLRKPVPDIGADEISGNVLPVTRLQFTGQKQGLQNKLYWTTFTETNSRGFGVERSENGNDFIALDFAVSKAQNGNSTSLLRYEYTDEKPLYKNYYRLKQTDRDGHFVYSSIILLESQASGIVFTDLRPNPASDNIQATFATPYNETIELIVTDATGRILIKQTNTITRGNTTINIPISNLSPGNYFVKALCNEGCKQVLKFVKQ